MLLPAPSPTGGFAAGLLSREITGEVFGEIQKNNLGAGIAPSPLPSPHPPPHHILFRARVLSRLSSKWVPENSSSPFFSEDWLKLFFRRASPTCLPVRIHLVASLSKTSPPNPPGPLSLLLQFCSARLSISSASGQFAFRQFSASARFRSFASSSVANQRSIRGSKHC